MKGSITAEPASRLSRYLTVEQAAAESQYHPETVARAIRSRELPAGKPRGRWRIERQDFERWMAGPEENPEPSPGAIEPKVRAKVDAGPCLWPDPAPTDT